MDLKDIRRLVIVALFADNELMDRFVLKGGNAKDIFEAKEVPLSFLEHIHLKETRNLHSVDWEAVRQTTTGRIEEFDFYFEYVVEIIGKLKSVGVE